ncbi:MAG: hypothetical protein Q9187_003770 [Circinaria calcarea]
MATMAESDGSEDVNDFLQRIRELGDKRDKEDEERTRKLEEEILQGRKERQARRAGECILSEGQCVKELVLTESANPERARSISPTKDSPSNSGTPNSLYSAMDTPNHQRFIPDSASSPPPSLSPSPQKSHLNRTSEKSTNMGEDKLGDTRLARGGLQPLGAGSARAESPNNLTPLSRAGTLTWQQRPNSRGSGSARTRPLSVLATENNAMKSPRSTPDLPSANEVEPSRSQIAQSLGAKDPAWFRQTADRGLGSAAFRKNRDDSNSDTTSFSASMRLPGMSRESTVEPEKEASPLHDDNKSRSPSREGSRRGGIGWSQKDPSAASISSTGAIGSPLPTLDSHRLDPPATDRDLSHGLEDNSNRNMAMSPSQGRMSPERGERPSSPTKGLGGFVQSAMMKRSDSVNKRWSTQAGPGISRGNSIASNRGGYDGSRHITSNMSPPREMKALNREHSPESISRPVSSQSNVVFNADSISNQRPGTSDASTSKGEMQKDDGFRRPALPEHSRTYPQTTDESRSASPVNRERTPPMSPSKTIDPKMWSPAKASWLESAINKPESPKPRVAPPQQPSWMVDINKAKQRGSADNGKTSNFKEVATGGLLRSPPIGGTNKSSSMTGSTSAFPLDSGRRGMAGNSSNLTKTTSLPLISKPDTTALADGKSTKTLTSPRLEAIDDDKLETDLQPEASLKIATSPSIVSRKSPISNKTKPITPPKKDFRSNLKPRRVSGGNEKKDEPEFKNVFGKLKRTQTQNYVAPDELKDNILRGKAGLALTGGPKKTERRDEFKESILQKKEEMKAGGLPNINRKVSGGVADKAQEVTVPEAIIKKQGLSKPASGARSPGISSGSTSPMTKDLRSSDISTDYRSRENTILAVPNKHLIAPVRVQKEPAANSKLADRFNPALVGLLSRGPSPLIGSAGLATAKSPFESRVDAEQSTDSRAEVDSSNSQQLTHMTKARAKGPKRRLPTSVPEASKLGSVSANSIMEAEQQKSYGSSPPNATLGAEPYSSPPNKDVVRPLADNSNGSNKMSHPQSAIKPNTPSKKVVFDSLRQPSPISPSSPKPIPSPSANTVLVSKQKQAGQNSPRIRKPSGNVTRPLPTPPIVPTPQLTKGEFYPTDSTTSSSLLKAEVKHRVDEKTATPVSGAAARWGGPQERTSQFHQKLKSPIKLPTRMDEEASVKRVGLIERDAQQPVGLGIRSIPDDIQKPILINHGLPSPPMNYPTSPPIPPRKPESIAHRIVSNGTLSLPSPQAQVSPVPKTSEARRLFTNFFDEAPSSTAKISIDTQAVLSSAQSPNELSKIKTLRKQIWQVTGDGKKIAVPAQHEHILYEQNMYLCTHVFGSSTGTRSTEVYLWCGDGVSSSAVEDAQLFSRKQAKEAGSKLIILRQGKETSNFFQALGGIMITRRGSSSTYMLCGRRHVGQIAFDEVPFTSSSLCSGFPYIISARFGKLYLWKGKGSGADELGCARLIGMDLGLTGEIEEVDECNEPNEFWEAFPDRKKRPGQMLNHWHLKPSCEKYTTRLFSIELESRLKSSSGFMWGRRGSAPALSEDSPVASIKEITPFTQSDLSPDGIFVLDAFFEIYIITGASTVSKFSTFRTALLFAQEYGILVASLEDRPFIPITSVVMAGTPAGMKTGFRKWDEGKGCTKKVERGEGEAVVVGLSAGLEAIGRMNEGL